MAMKTPAPASMTSLQSAISPDDPLGIAVMQRAKAARFQYNLQNPMAMTAGPLPDPRWDGFFQAVEENAPGGIKGAGRSDPMPGLPDAPSSPSAAFSATDDSPFGATPVGNTITGRSMPASMLTLRQRLIRG
jgi:hypothetical protein